MIYQAIKEYKQVTGCDKFKSVVITDDFKRWLFEEYSVLWHPGNPDYLSFIDKEKELMFRLKFS
jgi:hypothetical protein